MGAASEDDDDRPRKRRRSDDEADDQRERPRRRSRVEEGSSLDQEPGDPTMGAAWGTFMWIFLGIGVILAIVAATSDAVHAGGIAGLACFFGILARIFQAEQHRRS